MNAAEDLTDVDLLIEAVNKHEEGVTQAEERKAQMEENSEEKLP